MNKKKTMHIIEPRIEYADKGERRHHVLDEQRCGLDFMMLAGVIAEFELKPVIASESPLLDIDAIRMRGILQKELEGQGLF